MIPNILRRSAFLTAAALLAACRTGASSAELAGPPVPDSAGIIRDVRFLSDDRLEGRRSGTPGNDSAAAYIASRFAALGLTPVIRPATPLCAMPASKAPDECSPGWLQPFSARSLAEMHEGKPGTLATNNVVALLPGSDPALRGQYVVVGAHFDHLGRSTEGALDIEANDAIRNGADDNASGTAAVLELARLLRRDPPKRSVVFVLFSGEELGLLGSSYFVRNSPVPVDSVRAMLNFDMVGRLRDDRLIVYGAETAREWREILDRANAAGPALSLTATGDGFGASDHASFYVRDMPVLHFFTNVHDQYHKATDDAELIDAGGIARVVGLAERVTRDVADRAAPLSFVKAVAAAPASSSRSGTQAYLGSVPDMGATGRGMRISGVRSGSPADSAGLRAGDVIVEFDGTTVDNLQQYSDALYAKKPGDTVKIVVMREGQRVTLTATLGKRGG